MAELPPGGTEVCDLSELPDGGGRLFSIHVAGGEFRLLVLRSGDICFGYENHCPHFGVPLAECDRQLILKPHTSVSCNVHYSRFRWRDGHCEYGDCKGESLRAVPLSVEGGRVRFV